MGMGIGAAMTGLRPIVEGMNMGFLLLAYNQISNNAGMLHYTSGGQYKVGLRTMKFPSTTKVLQKQRDARHSRQLSRREELRDQARRSALKAEGGACPTFFFVILAKRVLEYYRTSWFCDAHQGRSARPWIIMSMLRPD